MYRLRKVCPQCNTVVHVKRSVYDCGHAFASKKRKARCTAVGEPDNAMKRRKALLSECNTRWLLDHANAIFISTDSYHEVIEHTEYTLGELHTDNTGSFYTKLDLTPTNIPTKQHN